MAEATGDLIGNKSADKKTSASKKSPTELRSKELQNDETEVPKKIPISRRKVTNYWLIKVSTKKGCIFLQIIDELRLASKERYISPEERQQIIDKLKLV